MIDDAQLQLISDALDAPHDADLHRRLDAAIAAQPEIADEFARWQRLEGLIRRALPAPHGIAWKHLHERLRTAVAEDAEDMTLDEAFAALPGVAGRVDWDRLQQRIAARVHADAVAHRPAAGRWRRLTVSMGAIAAAAAVVLTLNLMPSPPTVSPFEFHGVARSSVVQVDAPPTEQGLARSSFTILDEPAEAGTQPAVAAAEPIVFLVVDAPADGRPESDLAAFY